jgi:glycosyltransferase involved in cell wall biosynthesis
VGAVGRLEPIKNHLLLVRAFVTWVTCDPMARVKARLAIVGAGPLHDEVLAEMAKAGLVDQLWLPGTRSDVPALLKHFDCFVLPSLAEGTSCTLQEAMATGMKIIATDVGDNPRMLCDGEFGILVPSNDEARLVEALAQAMHAPALSPEVRHHIVEHYGMDSMLESYTRMFCSKAGRQHD